MKKFLFKLSLFSPILLTMMLVNIIVDPSNLIKKESYIEEVADILLQGDNVAGLGNYDERLLQKKYIEGLQETKEVVILGSSRAMMISEDFYPGRSFFNSSVSGASIEDQIAIYQLYIENEKMPSTVVICLDPWLLNRYNDQSFWKYLSTEYWKGLRRLGLSSEVDMGLNLIWLDQYKEIVSPTYFKQSLLYLRKYKSNTGNFYATRENQSDVMIKKSDGSISYPIDFSSAGNEEVRSRVRTAMATKVVSLGDFTRFDPQLQKQFEVMINDMTENGIEVVFYIAPYHPMMYDYILSKEQYRIILEVQDYFETFGEENNIRVVGSYDPADIPCSEAEFFDGYHPRPECIRKILD